MRRIIELRQDREGGQEEDKIGVRGTVRNIQDGGLRSRLSEKKNRADYFSDNVLLQ